uniref:Uncharacterized protein n=1 Tax=Brassica campestris TaxID=3711 RepID=A0A3P5ZJB4_BRACM|nr:unnamed protein product [Brassica rapa]
MALKNPKQSVTTERCSMESISAQDQDHERKRKLSIHKTLTTYKLTLSSRSATSKDSSWLFLLLLLCNLS